MASPKIRIGTRGSPLALRQAGLVGDALRAAHPSLSEDGAIEIVPILTSGDKIQDRTLAEIGGKGLFTREIEDGLLQGSLDLAVHSMKDMPTQLPDRLMLAAFLPRADVRDALVAPGYACIADLPLQATVGTAALRRKAQLLHLRRDLRVVPFRGNVGTRLRKLRDGEATATLLAKAGLDRLGQSEVASAIPVEEMVPAVGQGAICVECRADRQSILDLLQPIDHRPTALCIGAEHALLAILDGSCRTPIAGHAQLFGDRLKLDALVAREDGSQIWRVQGEAEAGDGIRLGRELGGQLRREAGRDVFGT